MGNILGYMWETISKLGWDMNWAGWLLLLYWGLHYVWKYSRPCVEGWITSRGISEPFEYEGQRPMTIPEGGYGIMPPEAVMTREVAETFGLDFLIEEQKRRVDYDIALRKWERAHPQIPSRDIAESVCGFFTWIFNWPLFILTVIHMVKSGSF